MRDRLEYCSPMSSPDVAKPPSLRLHQFFGLHNSSLSAGAKPLEHSQRKQLESTGRFNAVSVSKMVSEVLSGKEAAADVRANLKKEVEGMKVSDM